MKKLIYLFLVLALAYAGVAFAGGGTQELWPTYRLVDNGKELGVVYALDGGWLILTEEDILYVCGCEAGPCGVTVTNSQEPTDEPTSTPVPTDDPTPVPTDVPTQEPTKKPKCNSGRGNGSEGEPDCDPGNSGGHNHGGD
jgi:hypothetical protein